MTEQFNDAVKVGDAASRDLWAAVGAHLVGVSAIDAVHAVIAERGVVIGRRRSAKEDYVSTGRRSQIVQLPKAGHLAGRDRAVPGTRVQTLTRSIAGASSAIRSTSRVCDAIKSSTRSAEPPTNVLS